MKRCLFFAVWMIFFLGISSVWAEDYPAYTGRKLGRGLTNAAFGWTEVLSREEKTLDEHGPTAAIFWGPLDGLGNAVKRTAEGVFETLTFPFKTSADADPALQPEFGGIDKEKAGYRPKDYTF